MKFVPFAAMAVVQAAASSPRELQDTTIAGILTSDPSYSTLVTAASSMPGFVESLSDPATELTVFAPDNDSFTAVDQPLLEKLLTPPWQAHLADLLTYHAVEGTYLSTDIPPDGITLTMANGEDLDISFVDGSAVFSNAFVDTPFSSLAAADLTDTNGVVHGVSGVFLPPFLFYDLVDIAVASPDVVGTLTQLVQLAGLEDTLRDGEFTVLAPTNEAFDALDDELVATLTDPDNVELLRRVLLYHVIPELLPSSLLNSTDYVTAEGSSVASMIDEATSAVTFNGADVVAADLVASNGLVHVIDQVLVPPDLELPSQMTPAPAPSAMEPTPTAMEPSPPASEPMPTIMEPSPTAEPPTSTASSLAFVGLVTAAAALLF